ncbi:MAG: dihydropteroate synthase, partial [Coriobacteriia bacterium]|nr:dihydropteroate synthase [Coriobacteriia bacterium]
MIWQCSRFTFDLSEPIITGIVNVTPDSFSDGGEAYETEDALVRAYRMLEEGADIIEVGGESTRPGSDEVYWEVELARVLPVVQRLCDEDVVVSIDTRHAEVAQACIDAGAAIINDVSGFRDENMRQVVSSTGVGCVIMHMLGEPKSMQDNPHYDDVVTEVSAYLLEQASLLQSAGVNTSNICIDPGPGFGKLFTHNLALLKATSELASLGYPLMAAYSRKRF